MKFTLKKKDINLEKIAVSGQIFRMTKEEAGFRVHFKHKSVLIEEDNKNLIFNCSEKEFYKTWYDFFDFGTDYSKITKLIDKNDKYMLKAYEAGCGIRILRQDLWEIIISFIISQNNNIKRITGSISRLCKLTDDGSFPEPHTLKRVSTEQLRSFGLGYRDVYVKNMAERVSTGAFDLEALKSMSYEDAFKSLKNEYGIGDKVADCICLFGLHKLNAFPIDTHIKQILKKHYPKGLPKQYTGFEGVMQQYMFYHDLNSISGRRQA